LLLTAGLYRVNPRLALLEGLSAPDQALQRWDELLARRDVVGIAGADAHSRLPLTRSKALRFPSYESLFSLARDHLLLDHPLTGDAAADRAAILGAIRQGRLYVGLDGLAPADGFGFNVDAGAGGRWAMGETAPVVAGARAKAGGAVPRGTRLVLLRDGRPLGDAIEKLDVALPGPGVYRVEARVPGWPVPWVLSNPIYVCDDSTRDRRRTAAAWPAAGVARAVKALRELPGTALFTPEFDPSSFVDPAVDAPGAGPGGTGALKLAFRLGVPTPAQPFTWCALVNRQARDLAAYQGLRFRVKADGEYRVWVQVRDLNPASADQGLEWWLASVRTSTDWREMLLPFSRFRTINSKSDGRLDPDKARAIVFVLDGAAVKVGTQGTIWIADLGVYS
jgi:hypothetical protein